ncbi:hypothetical protein M378DRAFT_157259 [Amanita muscaria Koide BX008]|uniref:Uncharacterized protein n=1 Tax=Amanita muscaria (strain Koide BX008) TaxID=946122 RepID=A0A0C2X472_AMAMK|nr:hypothetical protein M378DRAFT_157259 [Amanita muscaria Koide BX008]
MRHKYEQVTAKQSEYLRQLDTANAKMKKLQAENDLLLDVVSAGGQWTPPPPLNDPAKPPYQVQQYPHHPSQPLPTAHPHHLPPYPAPSYSYSRSHEGYPPLQPTPTVMQGVPNSNYPGQPPAPTPPHHHHSHHRRSPHLIHVNGEKASSANIAANDYPTRTRTMESNERELPPSNPQILLPPSRSTHPHHHHPQQGPSPPSPPPSSRESNGRHQ